MTLLAWLRRLTAWSVALARHVARGCARAFRFAAWAATFAWVQGAAYLLVLVSLAESQPLVPDTERVLGDDSSRLEAWAEVRYAHDILRVSLAIAAAAVAVGALLGAVAWLAARVRALLAGRRDERSWPRAAETFAVVVVVHAALFAASMAEEPQFYAADWYEAGGARRRAMLALTGLGGGRSVLLALAGAAALYVLGPPWRWTRAAGNALRAARRVLARPRARWLLAGVGVAACAWAALRPRPRYVRDPSRPNVLVIAADSMRDDRLDDAHAPHLAALARRATRFDAAYVTLARTYPSWVTMLTGREPHHHGIRTMLPRWEERAKDFDALPARLAKSGWATAVVSDYAGDFFSGIDLGFQSVDAPTLDMPAVIRLRAWERATPLLFLAHTRLGRRIATPLREANAGANPGMLAHDALDALDGVDGKPFFLAVFFSTAHFPYAAPAPWFARFTDPAYDGRYKFHKTEWITREGTLADAEKRQVRGLYDGAVAAVDAAAGHLLDELRARGLEGSTIVVALADHGEDLFEAGRWHGHGEHLFGDAQNHIPLVIADPRVAGSRRDPSLVRDVDLAPTLYALTGVPPPPDLDGRALSLSRAQAERRPVFAETEFWMASPPLGLPAGMRWPYPAFVDAAEVDPAHHDEIVLRAGIVPVMTFAKHRSVRDERWKLVYLPLPSGPRLELFDAVADPTNERDVAAEHPDEVARLRAELFRWALGDPAMEERRGYVAPRGLRILPTD